LTTTFEKPTALKLIDKYLAMLEDPASLMEDLKSGDFLEFRL